ncbi:MAG: S8 family serine peptidase [Candidatus Puniceispirillales bacterium]
MACNPSPLFLVFSVSLAMVAVSSCGGGGGGGIAAAPSGPPRLQIEQPPIEISAIETEASPQIAQVSGFDVLSTGVSGSGIGVAVLDTGIMASHSEFGGRVRPGDDLQGDGDGTRDGNGHGTHAASLLAASGDGKGMLGIAPGATLYSYRILNDQGVFGGRSGNQMVPAVLGQVGEHGLPVVSTACVSGSMAVSPTVAFMNDGADASISSASVSTGRSPHGWGCGSPTATAASARTVLTESPAVLKPQPVLGLNCRVI